VSAHGEPQPNGLTETSPLALRDRSHSYVATKARAEAQLAGMRTRDFTVTVLRPGAICSSTNSHWGDRLVQRLQENGWPTARHPLDVIPWVHTEDLARMTLLCATTSAAADEAFLAVDANLSLAEFWGPICGALEIPIHVPDRSPTISRCQIGKIRRALGYAPRHPFDDTVAELVDYARRVRGHVALGTTP
jgi:nucleoside-diphosphate-sugar epimerase